MSNDRPDYRGNPLDLIETLTDVAGGLGNWIANGTPESGSIAGEIQQRYRDHCDAWSNSPTWVQQIDPGARLFLSNACKPWLDSQGSGDPVLDVPFTGGQCPGVEYEVVTARTGWTRKECDDGSTSSQPGLGPITVNVHGPIGGLRRINLADGDCGPRTSRIVLDAFDDDGAPISVVIWPIAVNGGFFSIGDINASISSVTRLDGQPDNCGDPQGEPGPNPNPRPDPGLDPEDEPFERIPGQPRLPMPEIPDPFGEPVQLPNFPFPGFDPQGDDGPSNPNVGPPVEPGDEIQGDPTDPGDDEFGDPPEGHIWVGFLVELSDQGVTEGLQVGSPPEPIYRSSTGNYRAVYEIEGEKVYSTPFEIRQQSSTYFLDLPGLTLVAARVNVPGNDSYSVTPLSQPVEEEVQEV